jgi:hypothetical protein
MEEMEWAKGMPHATFLNIREVRIRQHEVHSQQKEDIR